MLPISDAFAGGFLAAIVEGKPLETAVDEGHWLASQSIRELGPQYDITLAVQSSVFTDAMRPSQVPLPQEDLHSLQLDYQPQ